MRVACQATWTVYFQAESIVSFTTYIDNKGKKLERYQKIARDSTTFALQRRVRTGNFQGVDTGHKPLLSTGMSKAQVLNVLDGGLLTFLLHVESRTASACGMGFYTIGPCGEEMLGATGEALEETDAVALHYRHLSVNMVRSLRAGKSVEEAVLDRARGYTVSSLDPVTGGGHCCLGWRL